MASHTKKSENQELSIFKIDELICAIDIKNIQEINKHLEITQVYNAPSYVKGILNLRGQIITVIDLRSKFGFSPEPLNSTMRIIVVKYKEEKVGLLVDRILDVITADPNLLEAAPSNISGIAGEFFSNIYKMEEDLAAVLDVNEILKQGNEAQAVA